MRTIRLIGASCATTLSLMSGIAEAAPESGWWWNPNQSGRGFSIEIQGDSMFVAGYFYENDGHPTWLASAGPMQGDTAYQGRLSAYSGGQTLTGDYRVPSTTVDAGAITLTFSDDTHGTLTWPGGTVAIERFRFGSASTGGMQPETGWWWSPAESGRGIFFEVQGGQMFAAGYMYDAAGRAVWYASSGNMSAAASYQGRLDLYANGQTLAGPYKAPSAPSNAGSISAEFTAADRATVTLADSEPGIAAPYGGAKGKPKMINMERYRYGKVARPVRAKLWRGTYKYTFETGQVGVVDFSKFTVEGSITWVDSSTVGEPVMPLNGSVDYQILEGTAKTVFDETVTTTTGVCPGTTNAHGESTKSLEPNDGKLNLAANDTFSGQLFFPVAVHLTFSGTCANGDLDPPLQVYMNMSGKMLYLNMSGSNPNVVLIPGARVSSEWSFSAVQ